MDVYRVTLRPFCPPEGVQSVNPGGGPPGPSPLRRSEPIKQDGSIKSAHTKEMLTPAKSVEKPEKKQIPQSAKKEKLPERPAKEEARSGVKIPSEKADTPKKETESSLQHAIEDIHRKVALDRIQKKVAGRDISKGERTEGSLPNRTDNRGPPLVGLFKGPVRVPFQDEIGHRG